MLTNHFEQKKNRERKVEANGKWDGDISSQNGKQDCSRGLEHFVMFDFISEEGGDRNPLEEILILKEIPFFIGHCTQINHVEAALGATQRMGNMKPPIDVSRTTSTVVLKMNPM